MRWIPVYAGMAMVWTSAVAVPFALAEDAAPPIRNVTPPGMTPGPEVDGPLIRVPAPPRPPDHPRWRRFFLPVTSDAATFLVKGLTIRIAGVAPPAVDATCRLADESDWPCGRMALYGLRMFLHGRAVECFFAPPGDVAEVVAPCRVGKTDLARWLLIAGWAKPAGNPSNDDLAAETMAQCSRAGMWRGDAAPNDCRISHLNLTASGGG
jgi:endonuclease YncB( thermonuclease family)